MFIYLLTTVPFQIEAYIAKKELKRIFLQQIDFSMMETSTSRKTNVMNKKQNTMDDLMISIEKERKKIE